ncbi:MAG TPA: N-acetyl-gamma-glutamyl-phosphate reductase [Candidatus Cybelea sp.]|nr:N-acetyl-gamma-glutamyl-phosphate reductase [Candidatus Cybelea sp.]
MTRVHIWGAGGYAATEALRLLHAHPSVKVGVIESHSHAGELAGDHFPLLRTTAYRFDEFGSVLETVAPDEVVIVAGSESEAATVVPALLDRGARVIDLSSCYRFDESATYGLTEWFRDAIAGARLVANPGCYPTAALLATLPLASIGKPRHVVIDAKSGITGAGRTPRVGSLYAEVNGDIRAYGLNGHRHQPEIERYFHAAGIDAHVAFTPHVVPLARGMLVDVYALFDSPVNAANIGAAYERAYGASPFLRVLCAGRVPSVAAVTGTNEAELRVDVDGPAVRVICAIDNLGKGAAGQAVQNLNVMLGIREDIGLDARAIVA